MSEPRVLHVVVGPEQHGVVRHGRLVAEASGHALLRLEAPGPIPPDTLTDVDVLHLSFTDRLFAPRCEDAAAAVEALVAPLLDRGTAYSVTLHDLPVGESPLETRRRAAYDRVVAGADGIVVNSRRELELVRELSESARSLRMIPLPVDRVEPPTPRPTARWTGGGDVVLLGFLFPDRGYEHVIAELPAGVGLTALGRPSAGHDDLPQRWADLAAASGHRMRTSGFVADDDLAAELWAAGVPVAPNRRVAASGSINTWVGHGRRPLIPDSPYSRELADRAPGTVTLYDADVPGDLAAAIRRALDDPTSTWVADGTAVGQSVADVVAGYRRHFLGCAPERAYAVGVGRWTVPGNRWDLLPAPTDTDAVAVSVVVPHHDDQHRLDLVLTALTLQDHPRLQVVVADDGSPRTPSVAAADGLDVALVRQGRDGFRAAAARNLGARAADGEVLLFVDGDTLPEPGYVSAMLRLPAVAPEAVVVGRRRHADLTGWTTADVRGWLTGANGHRVPDELEEPGWLRDGYATSADLLRADVRSYRHVISAVFGLHRDLFAEVGGFSEGFRHYGGEDWELAHRLWVAGGVLAHVPAAVAWHDGPDWAGRPEADATAKNSETLSLSRLLPDPVARGGGQWVDFPAVVVELGFDDPTAVLATARAAFAHDTDCGVRVLGAHAAETVALLADPRIAVGPAPDAVLARTAAVVRVSEPVRLLDLDALVTVAATRGPLLAPRVSVEPTRVGARRRRWADDELVLRLFGGRDVVGPVRTSPVNLAHELKQVATARPGLRT